MSVTSPPIPGATPVPEPAAAPQAPAAQLVRRMGGGYEAVTGDGQTVALVPGVRISVDKQTQLDMGNGAPVESLHAAYHEQRLPDTLAKAIGPRPEVMPGFRPPPTPQAPEGMTPTRGGGGGMMKSPAPPQSKPMGMSSKAPPAQLTTPANAVEKMR